MILIGKCTWCGHKEKITLPPNSHCVDIRICERHRRQNVIDMNAEDIPIGPHYVVINTRGGRYYLHKEYMLDSLKRICFEYYELIFEKQSATVFEGKKALEIAKEWGGKIWPVDHR